LSFFSSFLGSLEEHGSSGGFDILLGMEKDRAARLLEEAGLTFSFSELQPPRRMAQPPGAKGAFRVIKQEMVNGALLLTISLFDMLDESGGEDE
jgi:hypothetical protein